MGNLREDGITRKDGIGRRRFLELGAGAVAFLGVSCLPGQNGKPAGTEVPATSDTGTATAAVKLEGKPLPEAYRLPWANGKYRTFDREEVVIDGKRVPVLLQPDFGTLGPDVDTIVGLDFQGDIDTDAKVVYKPTGKVLETRVVFIKRTDLSYVQFRDVLGGDVFDEYKNKPYGGDVGLDARAIYHAENSAHTHQKVVYLGDLGKFQEQWGSKPKEKAFLQRLIKAQSPTKLGIP